MLSKHGGVLKKGKICLFSDQASLGQGNYQNQRSCSPSVEISACGHNHFTNRSYDQIFWRIRQQLLTENKSGKYLIYSIGEIVLVVIEILIALQINNSNKNKKDRLYETAL